MAELFSVPSANVQNLQETKQKEHREQRKGRGKERGVQLCLVNKN
jgi:hypothetical protein